MKDILQKAEALVSDELPEGWQEVRDGNEIYYWHIWTGTIQYERPVLSAVSLVFHLSGFKLGPVSSKQCDSRALFLKILDILKALRPNKCSSVNFVPNFC